MAAKANGSGRRVAVVVHGAGSTRDTARRLLARVGGQVVAVPYAAGVDTAVAAIDREVSAQRAAGAEVTVVAGISLGAHAVARWTIDTGSTLPCGLVMPAWTGAPDDLARLTALTAREIESVGVARVLERVRREAPGDWVVDELVAAWSGRDTDELVAALDGAAASPAPTLADLARITAPTCVVALRDDPLHPWSVAAAWAGAIPQSVLVTLDRDASRVDRDALGAAVARGLEELRLSGSR